MEYYDKPLLGGGCDSKHNSGNVNTDFSQRLAMKPSNIDDGLVGMGQAIVREKGMGILATFGCSPCIGFAITDNNKAMLAHLQPEADEDVFVDKLIAIFPDIVYADIHVVLTTKIEGAIGVREKQVKSLGMMRERLMDKYDFLVFDDETLTVSDVDSIAIDLENMKIIYPYHNAKSFTLNDLAYMEQSMLANNRNIEIFS